MSKSYLLTIYTRTPLHIGCGESVDVIDQPVARERITGYPLVPDSGLKGALLERARSVFDCRGKADKDLAGEAKALFGGVDETPPGSKTKKSMHSAGVLIQEGRLLAFPVRSLCGCFAWITCPLALQRYQRDSNVTFTIPDVPVGKALAGKDVSHRDGKHVVLEEYAWPLATDIGAVHEVAAALLPLCSDSLWTNSLKGRLVILHDEDFQHYALHATEVVTRIGMNPATRTVKTGALFNQENVPAEALFYSKLTVAGSRREGFDADELLRRVLPTDKRIPLQIGGDESTGHGQCDLLLTAIEETNA